MSNENISTFTLLSQPKCTIANEEQSHSSCEVLEFPYFPSPKNELSIDKDRESGIDLNCSLDTSFDITELSSSLDDIRQRTDALFESAKVLDQSVEEERLQTQLLPSPDQPLFERDNLSKDCENFSSTRLQGGVETCLETQNVIPAGIDRDSQSPPHLPNSPDDSSRVPLQQENKRTHHRRRRSANRLVRSGSARLMNYSSYAVVCLFVYITCSVLSVFLHEEKYPRWLIALAAIPGGVCCIGMLVFFMLSQATRVYELFDDLARSVN